MQCYHEAKFGVWHLCLQSRTYAPYTPRPDRTFRSPKRPFETRTARDGPRMGHGQSAEAPAHPGTASTPHSTTGTNSKAKSQP